MAENEAAEAAPKKKSKLLIIIVAVVLLAGAGVGAWLMLKGDDKAASAEAEAEKPEPGAVVALDPVTINLAGGHYLKMAFALQATADAAEEPDGSKALDIAIATYTERDIAELSTAKGREAAKAEFLEKVKKAYTEEDKETVMDLYLTQFVTQ